MNLDFIIINIFSIAISLINIIAWPCLAGFIFRSEIKKILNAFASMLSRVERLELKDLSMILTSENVPESSKFLLTQSFILQSERKNLLNILTQVVNNLSDVQINIHSNNEVYPEKEDVVKMLKINLINLRDCLAGVYLLDGINIQVIIDKLEEQAPSIEEKNNPIVDALQLFDSKFFDKKPENFDLIIEIRKKILNPSK